MDEHFDAVIATPVGFRRVPIPVSWSGLMPGSRLWRFRLRADCAKRKRQLAVWFTDPVFQFTIPAGSTAQLSSARSGADRDDSMWRGAHVFRAKTIGSAPRMAGLRRESAADRGSMPPRRCRTRTAFHARRDVWIGCRSNAGCW